MNIVICGAGEVGTHSAEVLAARKNNITVIDLEPKRLAMLDEILDVRSLQGNGAHADVLNEAGCGSADLFIAATEIDEVNLLAATVAKGLGARRCIARVHQSAYFESRGLAYDRHLGIDHLLCPDYITAEAIAQTLRNPGALAVEQFARGQIEMQQWPVSDNSTVIGVPLADLELPESVRVVSIEREGAAFIPDRTSQITRGDVVTLVGQTSAFESARKLIHTSSNGRKRVAIMGGGALAVWLCRRLHSRAFSVRLFEPDAKRAEVLSAKLDWVTVVRADPIDPEHRDEQRMEQVDAFVALSDDDERNVLAAARAKTLGVHTAIAVQQRGTYLHMLEHIGIDRAFSPRSTAVAQIQQLLEDKPIRNLASLAVGIADVFEIRVPETAKKVIKVPLRELALPANTIVAAIQRGHTVHVPSADDWIAVGDTVLVIAPSGNEKKFRSLFTVK